MGFPVLNVVYYILISPTQMMNLQESGV